MSAPRVACCPDCGSVNISADAAVRWNIATQDWEVCNVFDKGKLCDDCGEEFIECEWRDATPQEVEE
jgi:predicted RNA-binding Zn-ribbon protein involved in translation (DUF1610 family)